MKALALLSAAAVAVLLVACGDTPVTTAPASKPAAAAADAGATASGDAGVAPLPKMEFAENDFAESDRNRDPFRTYLNVLAPEQKKDAVRKIQREVILPQYSIDELKLVAIVTGGEYPRAMMVDPGGKGWVIKRGDWVGRPEVVHIGGANGADYQINWRVDKVRDGDIVFTREDPAQPGIPPASRVIALRPDGDNAREKL
ncbi:MAG: pilus assembly protein PilP [Labilithrix sp.]|nr:pilus assembly protein PilP [Labilithrix sp.]MCW5815517.1 pilus assembly protein PilP [Labilithrix sp.]